MTQDELKRAAAAAALNELGDAEIIGVGTGSTVNFFIEALAASGRPVKAAISSSEASSARLQRHGIALMSPNDVTALDVYVDGADEINPQFQMIKGGGGALTREKIIAALARRFVCIVDASKRVSMLGTFPLPIEVMPMASAQVMRAVAALGGRPRLRADMLTDNGNQIIDVHGLRIDDAPALETTLNQIVGVVCNGLFAHRGADVMLCATDEGIVRLAR